MYVAVERNANSYTGVLTMIKVRPLEVNGGNSPTDEIVLSEPGVPDRRIGYVGRWSGAPLTFIERVSESIKNETEKIVSARELEVGGNTERKVAEPPPPIKDDESD